MQGLSSKDPLYFGFDEAKSASLGSRTESTTQVYLISHCHFASKGMASYMIVSYFHLSFPRLLASVKNLEWKLATKLFQAI